MHVCVIHRTIHLHVGINCIRLPFCVWCTCVQILGVGISSSHAGVVSRHRTRSYMKQTDSQDLGYQVCLSYMSNNVDMKVCLCI